MARIPDHRSPCRIDKAKGPRRHACSTEHADIVEGFREAQRLQEERAERECIGYATELEAYFHPQNGVERRLTFRDWLLQSRDTTRERYTSDV